MCENIDQVVEVDDVDVDVSTSSIHSSRIGDGDFPNGEWLSLVFKEHKTRCVSVPLVCGKHRVDIHPQGCTCDECPK